MTRFDVDTASKPGRPRVLLVDDDATILLTTESILEDRYDVSTARNAVEALAILADREFEAICTDYAMGAGMNSIDLLRRVASMPRSIGRVLVTGTPEVGESASLCYVLLKPYEPNRLLDVIDRAVSQVLARRRIAVSVSDARRATASLPGGVWTEGAVAAKRRT